MAVCRKGGIEMKRILLLLCVLVLLPGCTYILPPSNQPPKAYINAITPSEVAEGEMVSFSGYGTDVDGQVVAYRWRSDKDGQLSTMMEFETSSLSPGTHAIYFMVQDNNDAWSSEAKGSVTVTGGVSGPARVNSFTASALTVAAGESVTLSWDVSNATSISIDNGIGAVSSSGTVSVTPSVTTTYKLTAQGGGSTATALVTVTVQEPVLDIVFFRADPESVPSGSTSTLTWATTGASEVRMLPVIGVVESSGSVDVMVTGEQVHVFTLIATDGVDTVTAEVEIESYLTMPNHYTVELEADIDASGYVRSTGAPWAEYIYVGDDNNDIGMQGFVTFDISDIPADAVITRVTVDMSNYETPHDLPFSHLGCLRAYAHDYGALDGGDYWSMQLPLHIGEWCDFDDLDTASDWDGFKDTLQDKVGGERYQFRLQFKDRDTDDDGVQDLLRWSDENLPRMTVEYYSYE
jgi:hypothetical protein